MRIGLKLCNRSFSSLVQRGAGVTGHPPLDQPFPGVASLNLEDINTAFSRATQITKLSNGLRVASSQKSGGMCSVGVVLESGARNEKSHKKGVSHFLEKLSFSRTRDFESPEHMVAALEPYGGMYESLHFKDVAVFIVSCLPDGLDTATDILSQTLLHSNFSSNDIEAARESIACEIEMFKMGADQEPIVTDLVHAAAYGDTTLGNHKICPISTLPYIDKSDLVGYYKSNYLPSRMVLVGVGVEHGALVKSAQKYFPTVLDEDASDRSVAEYRGGQCYRHDAEPPPSIGPQELPTLTHVSIGFKSSSHQDDDYVKFCVLNTLMGGGGSFSAGGPGKGMYTRLYLQVLNRYHWIYSALALNHPYQDSGIFTINGSSHPNHGWDLTQVIIKQFKEMQNGKINHSELERAKTQLKSTLLMNLEYRNIELEDIGRQVVASDERKSAAELCAMIESVTPQQLQSLAKRMLESKPSVGAFGDLKNVPNYEEIEAAFKRENGELTNRISHFLLKGMRGKTTGLIKS